MEPVLPEGCGWARSTEATRRARGSWQGSQETGRGRQASRRCNLAGRSRITRVSGAPAAWFGLGATPGR